MTQFSSIVYQHQSNAKSLRKSRGELIDAISEVEKQLEAFKSSFEHIVPWDEPVELKTFTLTSVLSSDQMMIVYFLYYCLLLDMHGSLMVPWLIRHSRTSPAAFHKQTEHSCNVVASAARKAILASRFIHLSANCPVLYDV